MITINELQTTTTQLPDTIEDLTKFVLVGKTKLNEYLVKLRTIDKLSIAQEVRNQTLEEAQELNAALFAAEQRIGELLLVIPKHTAYNNPSGKSEPQNRDISKLGKSKSELTAEMGYTKDEVSDYQQMAKNPEIVQQVLDEAVANGTVASKSQVMAEIKKNNELKKRLAEQEQELQKLRNRPEQIREVTKEVVRKVVPEDYELLKARVNSQSKEEKRLTDEYHRMQAENAEQKARIKQLEERDGIRKEQDRLEREAEYFDMHVTNFIRTVGGYVWITERLDSLSEDKRNRVVQNIKNINAWTQQMILNIGGELIGK